MQLYVLSVNHHNAPIAVRERVAFSAADMGAAFCSLEMNEAVHEAAILSTCNRTELYCLSESCLLYTSPSPRD